MNKKKPSAAADRRPKDFGIKIQGGMLEALGINMYSTLGKCLVEFLANAYDAEAREDFRLYALRGRRRGQGRR